LKLLQVPDSRRRGERKERGMRSAVRKEKGVEGGGRRGEWEAQERKEKGVEGGGQEKREEGRGRSRVEGKGGGREGEKGEQGGVDWQSIQIDIIIWYKHCSNSREGTRLDVSHLSVSSRWCLPCTHGIDGLNAWQ
jgi:hypothetical protein